MAEIFARKLLTVQHLRAPSLWSMVPLAAGVLIGPMEVLFRVMRPVAEQRVMARLREKAEVQPELIADEVINEFRKFVQFETHADALRARVRAHVERLLHNHARGQLPRCQS